MRYVDWNIANEPIEIVIFNVSFALLRIFVDPNSIFKGFRRAGAQPGPRNPEMSDFFM